MRAPSGALPRALADRVRSLARGLLKSVLTMRNRLTVSRLVPFTRVPSTIAGIAALLLASLLGGACTDEHPTIGLVLPKSGTEAVYGSSVEQGARLAFQELQARFEAGQYPYSLQLRTADSGGDPDSAAHRLGVLYDDGAVAAIGAVTDGEAQAMAAVATKRSRVLLEPTASRNDPAAASRYVFHLQPSATREADKIGSFAVLELKLDNAAILVPRGQAASDLVEAFRTQFERSGGQVVDTIEYVPATGAVPDAVRQVLAKRPQAVYLAVSAADPAARGVVEALRKSHFGGAVLTTSAFAAPAVVEDIGRTSEGLFLSRSSFDPKSDRPEVQDFVQAYQDAYGAEPDVYAAYGYDAMMVLARALADQHANQYDLWKGLRGLSDYQGVTGYIQFNEQGEVGQFPRVYVVENGRLAPFQKMDERSKKRLVRHLASLGSARSALSSVGGPAATHATSPAG